MGCTEKLRHLLDERGMAWRRASNYSSESKDAKDEETIFVSNGLEWYAREFSDNYLLMRTAKFIVTPKQAIEATTGRDECHIEHYDTDMFDGERHYRCSACHSERIEWGDKYCPNCGRVVSE